MLRVSLSNHYPLKVCRKVYAAAVVDHNSQNVLTTQKLASTSERFALVAKDYGGAPGTLIDCDTFVRIR
jgi:hypothetical protein